jgi:hypothetical protein
MNSLNQVQSRNLIPNQFNFKERNHEKNINLENLQKKTI